MKHKTLYLLLTGLMLLSMLLTSCVEEPPAVETEVIVEPTEPVVVFEPLSLSAPDCEYGGLFKSMEAVDQYTVRFTMCAPDPAFLSKIAFTAFAIQPCEHLEATGGGGPELLEHPIGTGPYMIGEWKRGDELVLTRFEDYWGEACSDTHRSIPLELRGCAALARAAIRHSGWHR